ncbi:hypothetical protein Trydic_g17496 [Trypoxylus dichotomus]
MSSSWLFAIVPVFRGGHKRIAKIGEAILAMGHNAYRDIPDALLEEVQSKSGKFEPKFNALARQNILLKYILIIYNKQYVEELLIDGTGGFWDRSHFDGNFMANERKYFGLIDTIQLVLPISATIAAISAMLRPVFHANRLFILETLFVDSTVVNTIVMAFQFYLFLLAVPVIVGYDSFYLASCVQAVAHVRRLQYKLEDLSRISTQRNAAYSRLIYCIKHHQFLIRTLRKLQSMFSFTLLFHYFVTLLTSCVVLYELMGSGEYNIEQVLNAFVLLSQFGYYAFPAGQVASEFDELSSSLFLSGWQQKPLAFQKLILFAMARSQKKEQFFGGGIVPINEDTFGSILLKYILIIYNKQYVEELLVDGTGGFWDRSRFDGSFMLNERKYFGLIDTIQLVLPISATIAAISFMLRPILHANRLFILEALLLDSIVVNTIVLAFQYYLFLLIVPLIVGYDTFYFASCVHAVSQVRRLRYKLEGLSKISKHRNAAHDTLIYCIKHHQFLVRTLEKIQTMFSFTLLFHYFATLLSCCIVLYELMGSGEYNIEQVLNAFVLLSQFGYYAFPAGQITSEFDELSTSLFVSGWHQSPLAFKKLVLFIMAKTQRKEQLSGGGIIPINEDTFGSVVRKSFSFYAILRNLLNK